MNGTKLSLLAMYDDMCRFSNSLVSSNKELTPLLQNYEDNRKKWAFAQHELFAKEKFIQKLESENHELKARVQSFRLAFAREVKAKETLQKDYNELRSKLSLVHGLLNEDKIRNNNVLLDNDSKSKLISVFSNIDLNTRNSLKNSQFHFTSDFEMENDSNDELLFDKSDDNLDELFSQTKIRKLSDSNHIYSVPLKSSSNLKPVNSNANVKFNQHVNHYSTIEEEDINEDVNILNTGFISSDDPKDSEKNKENENSKPSSPTSLKSVETAKSTSTSDSCKTTSTLSRQLSNKMSKATLLRTASRLQPEILDSRGHTFQQKKAIRPINCVPCGKSIGFCSNYVVCVDCRGVAHPKCRDLLSKPCIPYYSSPALRKITSTTGNGLFSQHGNMIMIGDFAPQNTRPCIPALLIHCCNEIKRRIDIALKDPKVMLNPKANSPVVGVYRLCGFDKAIRDLRVRILEAKNGIPNLSSVDDIHVICGVIKLFLRDLDDPLITRILWQDFARASEHVLENVKFDQLPDSGCDDLDSSNDEENESIQLLKEVILQLPNANRDSLAFLFLHFRHIIDSASVTLMDAKALAKIFGPTVVGSKVLCPSTSNLISENVTQISVMNALFLISRHFWYGILKDPNFCPFKAKYSGSDSDQKSSNSNLKTQIKKMSSTCLRDLIEDRVVNKTTLSKYKTTIIDINSDSNSTNDKKRRRQRSSIDLKALY